MDLPCSATTITSLSELPLSDDAVLIFDLDDTLYAERDYVRSGFWAVSQCFGHSIQLQVFRQLESLFDHDEADPFGFVLKYASSDFERAALLQIYREHEPRLELQSGVREMFQKLAMAGRRLGILTDGRSISQRNKIRALGLDKWISEIVISEEFGSSKPDPKNYQHFEQVFPSESYVYIGDNLTKDFVTPNLLGWLTVALMDRGQNIHSQRLEKLESKYYPDYYVRSLTLRKPQNQLLAE